MSQAIALSKSYPFFESASSSSDGAKVDPNTELSTSSGVMPSVRYAVASESSASLPQCMSWPQPDW